MVIVVVVVSCRVDSVVVDGVNGVDVVDGVVGVDGVGDIWEFNIRWKLRLVWPLPPSMTVSYESNQALAQLLTSM